MKACVLPWRAVATVAVCLVLAVSCCPALDQELPLETPPAIVTPAASPSSFPAGVDPFEHNRLLGRGVNMGNALEAPTEGAWGVVLKQEYFDLVAEAGFDSVRIPVRWSTHADETAPYIIDPAFFTRVDQVVDQALSRDLLVVINVHHYEEIMQQPAQHEERLLAMWSQIADHYRDYPDELLFEVLNEPNGALTPTLWNALLVDALDVIRETNPDRTVIVGPGQWNSILSLLDLTLPEDDRHIIVTVHYYDPFHFTHQGAEWVNGSDSWLGTTWEGSASQEQDVDAALDLAAAWSEHKDRPVYLGEFGAYSKADMQSRALWTAYVARQAEERGISWAYWEFCSGFGVYDKGRGRWNEALLNALLPADG
jgi:endoglucanase